MGILAKARGLGAGEWRILLLAAWLVPLVRARLAVGGLARVLASRTPVRRAPQKPALAPRRVGQLRAARARRLPWCDNCLVRSLVTERLLRLRGMPADLRIGVRVEEGRLEAHAWVECEGEPIDGMRDARARYSPFE